MPQFTDTKKRPWVIDVNVTAIKRVLSLVDFDLRKVLDGDKPALAELLKDEILLCNCLYALCKPQADALSPRVSDEDFGEGLGGDAIEHATQALIEGLIAFCRSPRQRASLGRAQQAMNQATERAHLVVEKRIQNGELDRIVNEALAPIENEAVGLACGQSSSSSPAPSASIPVHSP